MIIEAQLPYPSMSDRTPTEIRITSKFQVPTPNAWSWRPVVPFTLCLIRKCAILTLTCNATESTCTCHRSSRSHRIHQRDGFRIVQGQYSIAKRISARLKEEQQSVIPICHCSQIVCSRHAPQLDDLSAGTIIMGSLTGRIHGLAQ